jgi:hypothetical protein
VDFVKQNLDLNHLRRFGAEIEINAFDMRSRPIGHADGRLPEGTHYVASLLQKTLKKSVKIHKWSYDHNNMDWILKPDSSCGIEICTPVLKGWKGVLETCKAIEALGADNRIVADERCSFHVHIDVSDLSEQEVATIVTWWVKCEPVFMDSVPLSRKRNQYCQLLGQSEIFEKVEDQFYSADTIIRKLGCCKYFTINTYHYHNNKRKTIEFRIMDSDCCLDPWNAKNWIRLIIHFIEMSINKGMPNEYHPGDPWSGYCWLDPKDVFEFLGFGGNYNLSNGLQQVCEWFVDRLYLNVSDTCKIGVMSESARCVADRQINDLFSVYGKMEADFTDIFDEKFRI